MAKKSHRRKERKIRLSAAQLMQPGATEVTSSASALVQTAEVMPDWREEYGYVMADLKRMSIVAAAALVVVIVLVLVLA
jgi:hypothetical protein